jgi:hypothetical protein
MKRPTQQPNKSRQKQPTSHLPKGPSKPAGAGKQAEEIEQSMRMSM